PNTAQYIINNKVVKSNTVTILTPVKDKSNSININQIQQSIKDNHRLKNSNNKILNSFNDITINIKFINHIIKDLNQDNMSFLDSKVVDRQLKSLLLKKDDKDGRKNRIKNQKNGDENKVKDVQTEELPKTGLTNNLTIVVLGSLLILLS
ncbi:isopeptide-forming domain-containing fimbrial protein, partial [Staphylococcus epidermidis]